MRRLVLGACVAGAVILVAGLAGCGSSGSTATHRATTTVTVTQTPDAGTDGSSNPTGITVVGPDGASGANVRDRSSASGAESSAGRSGSGGGPSGGGGAGSTDVTGTTGSSGPSTDSSGALGTGSSGTSSTSSTTPTTPTTVSTIRALKRSCLALLTPNEISQALGTHLPSEHLRIVEKANPDVKMAARIKCYYGTKDVSESRPLVVALSQYASAKAAEAQLGVTVSSEKNLGAQASTVTVQGNEAHVLLRDGGFLIMRHGAWTLSIAIAKGTVTPSKLSGGLQKLAQIALPRAAK